MIPLADTGTFLRREQQGNTLLLTVARPPVNALSLSLLDELAAAMAAAGGDAEVRTVVVTGEGTRYFAVGADIRVLPELNADSGRTVNLRFQEAFNAVAACPVPVICAINGLALGGGLELALACDIRIAARGSAYGLPEAALGLIPGGGGTQRLPRLIPPGKARELLFTGRRIGAEEALRCGLVEQVVPAEHLLPAALDLAGEIAARGPGAVRAMKAAVARGMELPLDRGLAVELELSAGLFGTHESREGIEAFFNKRHPAFATPPMQEGRE